MATNALEHNFLPMIMAAVTVASVGYGAYEVYNAYKQGGIEAAVQQLGIEVVQTAAGGVVGKVAGKVAFKYGGKVYDTLKEAVDGVFSHCPGLKFALGSTANTLIHAAEKFNGSQVGQWVQKVEHQAQNLQNKLQQAVGLKGPKPSLGIDLNGNVAPKGKGPAIEKGGEREIVGGNNSGFYQPHEVRGILEKKYPGKVSSSTVPPLNQKNVKLAGQRHPQTGIVFDNRGFPIFDEVAKFDTKILKETALKGTSNQHKREATKMLLKSIEEGKISVNLFNSQQLEAIMVKSDRIPGYIWHHHQDIGRMQLVPKQVHIGTGHVGGDNIWPKKVEK